VSTRLLLVRHGQTHAVLEGRTQGRADNPLNDHGRRQALALRPRLFGYAPAAIIASPAIRAVATVQPVADDLGLTIELDPRLLEMDYGSLDGLNGVEMRAQQPEFMERWSGGDPSDLRLPGGGETLREVQARVVAATLEAVAGHPEQTVLLCAHNFALRALLCHVLGLPLGAFRNFQVDLASYSVVEASADGFLLTLLNEVCQLAD
jgi:broad specificity phosphatase PhoE